MCALPTCRIDAATILECGSGNESIVKFSFVACSARIVSVYGQFIFIWFYDLSFFILLFIIFFVFNFFIIAK